LQIEAVDARASLHPALIMAMAGVVSGLLSTFVPGSPSQFENYSAPGLGVYMVLAGLWFGLVVALGLWRSGRQNGLALAATVIATWIAWEIAVNIAMQIVGGGRDSSELLYYAAGIASGAVGAFLTWAGAAWARPLRNPRAAALITAAGALFGLLLPWSLTPDLPALLFVPWQAAVAAAFGWLLHQRPTQPQAAWERE
jgi:hypothetical protein